MYLQCLVQLLRNLEMHSPSHHKEEPPMVSEEPLKKNLYRSKGRNPGMTLEWTYRWPYFKIHEAVFWKEKKPVVKGKLRTFCSRSNLRLTSGTHGNEIGSTVLSDMTSAFERGVAQPSSPNDSVALHRRWMKTRRRCPQYARSFLLCLFTVKFAVLAQKLLEDSASQVIPIPRTHLWATKRNQTRNKKTDFTWTHLVPHLGLFFGCFLLSDGKAMFSSLESLAEAPCRGWVPHKCQRLDIISNKGG